MTDTEPWPDIDPNEDKARSRKLAQIKALRKAGWYSVDREFENWWTRDGSVAYKYFRAFQVMMIRKRKAEAAELAKREQKEKERKEKESEKKEKEQKKRELL